MKTAISTFIFFMTMALCLPALSAGFIKFDGVDGESRDKDHKGWIEITSVSQGMASRDAASGLATGKRQHKPVTITKSIDKASPVLAKALASGSPLSNVRIEVDGHVTVLKSAQVTSIEADGKGNEIITLTPGSTTPGTEAKKKGNVESSWKVEEGQK